MTNHDMKSLWTEADSARARASGWDLVQNGSKWLLSQDRDEPIFGSDSSLAAHIQLMADFGGEIEKRAIAALFTIQSPSAALFVRPAAVPVAEATALLDIEIANLSAFHARKHVMAEMPGNGLPGDVSTLVRLVDGEALDEDDLDEGLAASAVLWSLLHELRDGVIDAAAFDKLGGNAARNIVAREVLRETALTGKDLVEFTEPGDTAEEVGRRVRAVGYASTLAGIIAECEKDPLLLHFLRPQLERVAAAIAPPAPSVVHTDPVIVSRQRVPDAWNVRIQGVNGAWDMHLRTANGTSQDLRDHVEEMQKDIQRRQRRAAVILAGADELQKHEAKAEQSPTPGM